MAYYWAMAHSLGTLGLDVLSTNEHFHIVFYPPRNIFNTFTAPILKKIKNSLSKKAVILPPYSPKHHLCGGIL